MAEIDWIAMRTDYLNTLVAYRDMATLALDEVKHNG